MGSIVLSGYYGFDNIGDEAVMYSIIKTLQEEIEGDINITVLSNTPQKTAARYNVEAVNRWSYKDIISAIKKSDLLISGGGSLLQDITGWKSVIYYLSVVFIAKVLRKKVVFYGQGIGPVRRKFNRFLIRMIVNRVDYISVRDEQSKEELIKMGIKKKQIDVIADPVLGLKPEREKAPKENQKKLGVYLRDWNAENNFFEKMKDVLNWFSNQGWEVIFIPMHYPEDIEIAKKVSKDVLHSTIYDENHFPENILNVTSTMDYVIAMRLHGLIMAAAAGVPYMGLSYDPKVTSFIDTMKVGKVVDINQINKGEVLSYLKKELDNLDELKQQIKHRKNELLSNSNHPIECIKACIKN